MEAIVQHTHGAPDVLEFQERLARVTGLLYRVIAVLGIFSPIAVQALVVPVDSLTHFFVADFGGLVRAILLAPAVVGEIGLTAWLLVKGVKVRRETATSPRIVGATGGTR